MSGGLIDKVFIGLDNAPAAFDIRGRILGSNGTNLEYIRSETGVVAVLKGDKFEPLHLALHHTRSDALVAARSLAQNLIETIRAELAQWSAAQAGGPPPPLNVPPPALTTTSTPQSVQPPAVSVALATPTSLAPPAHTAVMPPVVSVASATAPLMTVRQPAVLQLLPQQQQYVLNQENGQLIPIVQPGMQMSNSNFTSLPIAQSHLHTLQQHNFGATQLVDISNMQPVNVTQLRLSGVPSSMSMILPNGLTIPQSSISATSDTTTVSSATSTPVVCAAPSLNSSQKMLYSMEKCDKQDMKYHIQGAETVQWAMPGSQTMLIPYQQLQEFSSNQQGLANLQPQQYVSIAPAGGLPATSLPLSTAQWQQLQTTGIMQFNQKPTASSAPLINIISTGQASSPQIVSNTVAPTKNSNLNSQDGRAQKRMSDGSPSQLQLRPIAPAGSQVTQDKATSRDRSSVTWTAPTGDEFVFRDPWGGISLMFAANHTTKVLMPNTTYRSLEPGSFSLSADRRFLLLARNVRQLHTHSYIARYTIYDVLTTESYPLTPLPDEVRGVVTEGPLLLLATWTPKGHGLITVKDNNIYYRPAPRSSTGYRVTENGIPGTIYNGVPDWLYEEEILRSRSALWMSADGHMVLYATFNDSLVHEQRFPWYGAALDTDDPDKAYPQIRSVRYPKPGTNNPTVTLTVADIADPKHIRTRHLTPPKTILEQGDFYLTSAQWVSLTEVCAVWLTRPQNLSVVSICKSPMWYCQEVYRITSGSDSWVESAPSPLWSAGGGALATLAPIRDGPAGLFRHVVRVEHNSHGPRALPLTHGSFDVVRLLAWDHTNQHIYYLGIPEGKPGQQHLYRVSAEAPRPGSPQKLPYCVTCNAQPSPSINLEYYGNLASSGDSAWDSDWDDEPPAATSPAPPRKKKKKDQEMESQPQPCLYHEAQFSPSSGYFVLECLGPGVPSASLYYIALPEPRLIAHLQNNTAVKERLSAIALPTPRTFSVQLSSGQAARVRLLLPPGLREDEVTKYPLVLAVHGAPGTQIVTERWALEWAALAAGAGAVLAAVDARGAAGRGLGAHHSLHRRLGTLELADQLEVAEYLRDSLHFVDARRVAVWGRAHGGFLAALALASPLNVFHCGVAIAPIVRWRYYASAYAERYMGVPNATGNYRGYADADVTKQAGALRDKMLLLVHGAADDNVHLQQSMALARALADQGAMFRQQIYPDEGHALSGVRRHVYRTMSGFLDDCFRKQVPPETKAGLRNGGNLD